MHPGVGDQQATRLGLLQQRHRGQVVADGLVDEALVVEVEQQRVLAVVEREPDEVSGVGEGDAARDEVPVEARVVGAGRGSHLPGQAQPVAPAVRVGAQRDGGGVRVHVRGPQLRVGLEAAGRDHGRAGPDLADAPVGELEPGTGHASTVAKEPRVRVEVRISPRSSTRRRQSVDVLVGVERMAAAEPEDGLGLPDVYAEGADPLDAVGEAVDQGVAELRVTFGHDLVDDLTRGRRPGVAREENRTAQVVGDLDHEHPGTVVGSPGGCGEAGHPASQDQEVDGLRG